MVLSSKFTFPGLGRFGNSDRDGHSTKQATSLLSKHNPTAASMSKAEALLGPSETGSTTKHVKSYCERRRLKKQPSAVSIAIEPGYNASRSYRHEDDRKRADNASTSSFVSRSVHTARSTCTLRSHYDSTQNPHLISQQTAISTARDGAYHKGYPPVSSSLRQIPLQDGYGRPGFRPESKKHPEPMQRKTSYVGLSTLLSEPGPPKEWPAPHYDAATSPSVLSSASDSQPPKSPSLRNWLGWKRNKAERDPMLARGGFNGYKVEAVPYIRQSKEPRAELPKYWAAEVPRRIVAEVPRQRGDVENWLDDPELEDDFDTMGERTTLEMFKKGNRPSPRPSPNVSGDSSNPSSSSVQTLTSQISTGKLASRSYPVIPRRLHHPQTKDISASPPGRFPPRSNSLRVGKMRESDLQIHSVLALSSSDDDSDCESKARKTNPRNIIRGVAVTVYETQNPTPSPIQAKHNAPDWDLNTQSYQHKNFAKPFRHVHSSSKGAGKSFLSQPSVHWDLNNTSKDHASPHSSSKRLQPIQPHSDPSPQPRDASPTPQPCDSTPSPSFVLHDSTSTGPNRMMAVSAEEERLLSAMRSKRLSIRKAVLAEGISLALESGLGVPRPKTAETERSGSFFETDVSSFPNPPGVGVVAPRLSLSKAAFSNDDLRLLGSDWELADDAAIAAQRINIQPTPNLRDSLRATSASGPSSRFGSMASASELLPSPTTSYENPPTPPPRVLVEGEGYEAFGSPTLGVAGMGAGGPGQGHVRKRTLSSVLFLDGVEERARQREEELELWAVEARA